MRTRIRTAALLAALIGALCLAGCTAQQRVLPRLPDPGVPFSPFVQSATPVGCAGGCSGGPTFTINFAQPVGPGDTVKVAIRWFADYQIKNPNGPGTITATPPNPTVTDGANSVYSLIQAVPDTSGQQFIYLYSTPAVNSNGDFIPITITLPIYTPNIFAAVALEYSAGGTLDNQISQQNCCTPTGPSIIAGPLAIRDNPDILLSMYAGSLTGLTACTGCNLRYSGPNFVVQDFFTTAAGSFPIVFTIGPRNFSWDVIEAAGFN